MEQGSRPPEGSTPPPSNGSGNAELVNELLYRQPGAEADPGPTGDSLADQLALSAAGGSVASPALQREAREYPGPGDHQVPPRSQGDVELTRGVGGRSDLGGIGWRGSPSAGAPQSAEDGSLPQSGAF